jgi:hypothetical protein
VLNYVSRHGDVLGSGVLVPRIILEFKITMDCVMVDFLEVNVLMRTVCLFVPCTNDQVTICPTCLSA